MIDRYVLSLPMLAIAYDMRLRSLATATSLSHPAKRNLNVNGGEHNHTVAPDRAIQHRDPITETNLYNFRRGDRVTTDQSHHSLTHNSQGDPPGRPQPLELELPTYDTSLVLRSCCGPEGTEAGSAKSIEVSYITHPVLSLLTYS